MVSATPRSRRVRSSLATPEETYTPLTPRVPCGPDGPRPMAPEDVANVVRLDGVELTRFTLGKAVAR